MEKNKSSILKVKKGWPKKIHFCFGVWNSNWSSKWQILSNVFFKKSISYESCKRIFVFKQILNQILDTDSKMIKIQLNKTARICLFFLK